VVCSKTRQSFGGSLFAADFTESLGGFHYGPDKPNTLYLNLFA
jgi:hypothetical protein